VKPVATEYKSLGNIQLTQLMGAEHESPDADQEEVMKSLRAKGEVPYWIPSGASTHPLGGCGYARFAFEIVEQEKEMDIFFDTIILPCASGSTLGGTIAGFKLHSKTSGDRRPRKIIGIDAFADEPGKSEATILQIARTAAGKIGILEEDIQKEDVEIDLRWNAGSYGFVDERTQDAMKLLASLEGILTDPVYTGKALAGLIGKARSGELRGFKNVLFVHTGGVPTLSAYPNVR
jgi:1-aminocyclopropane-1-carboxylate deaminase